MTIDFSDPKNMKKKSIDRERVIQEKEEELSQWMHPVTSVN